MRAGIASVLLCAAFGSGVESAMAEQPVERGSYLVNTIMACSNCHTPRDAGGNAIVDRAFSGNGLTLDTPAAVSLTSRGSFLISRT